MEKEEQIFRNRVTELAELSFRRDVPAHTEFLTLQEQTIFRSMTGGLPPVRYELTGGFAGAERKVVCFLPSYEEVLYKPPFECLRISPANRKFAEELGHRDVLGALMSLGIERSMIGDIVLKDGDAYTFVLEKMAGYVAENLVSIRHTTVRAGICEIPEDSLAPETEEISGTVSSLRLDALVALAGRLSRTKAAAYIEGEKVFVNGETAVSASRLLKEGDILSIRGIGKFRFQEAGGQTKKGRTGVILLKYV